MRLAARLEQMVDAAPPAGAKQPALAIARQVVAHSLDFDAGVLPCEVILPYARKLDQAVESVVAKCMDIAHGQLPEKAVAQMHLPRRLGGLQVSSLHQLAPLARAATLMAIGP